MSDYTPTTEEVRKDYSAANWDWQTTTLEEAKAEFDRWLAEVKAKQDEATTERIIALLEERNWHYYYDWNPTPEQVSGNVWGIREAITLIRGENK